MQLRPSGEGLCHAVLTQKTAKREKFDICPVNVRSRAYGAAERDAEERFEARHPKSSYLYYMQKLRIMEVIYFVIHFLEE